MKNIFISSFALVALITGLNLQTAFASTSEMSYEGVLTDVLGNPMTAPTSMSVRITDGASCVVHTQSFPSVTPDASGFFTLKLTGLTKAMFELPGSCAGTARYFELTVDGETFPLVEMDSTPYSMIAGKAQEATSLVGPMGGTTTGQILTWNQSTQTWSAATPGAMSLPDLGTAGTYGSSSSVPVLTTDVKGRVTAVANTAISITPAAITGTIPVSQGGTGATSLTTGQVVTGGSPLQTLNCSNGEVIKYNASNQAVCGVDDTGPAPADATTTSKGIVQIGTGLNVSSGTVSVALTTGDVPDLSSTYVNLNGMQTITGAKTFESASTTISTFRNSGTTPSGIVVETNVAANLPAGSVSFRNNGTSISSIKSFAETPNTIGGIAFYTNNGTSSERMRISPAGNVGIAQTNPDYKLDVNGDVNITGSFRINGIAIGGGSGTVTNVTASSPLNVTTSSTTPALSISSGTTAGDTLRWSGSTWTIGKLQALDLGTSGLSGNTVPVVSASSQLTDSPIRVNGTFVGVGTNPTTSFHVAGDGRIDGSLVIKPSSNDAIRLKDSADTERWHVLSTPAGKLGFYDYQNSAERLTILSGGNVGIGQTNPSHKLDVNGPLRADTVTIGSAQTTVLESTGSISLRLPSAIPGPGTTGIVMMSGTGGYGEMSFKVCGDQQFLKYNSGTQTWDCVSLPQPRGNQLIALTANCQFGSCEIEQTGFEFADDRDQYAILKFVNISGLSVGQVKITAASNQRFAYKDGGGVLNKADLAENKILFGKWKSTGSPQGWYFEMDTPPATPTCPSVNIYGTSPVVYTSQACKFFQNAKNVTVQGSITYTCSSCSGSNLKIQFDGTGIPLPDSAYAGAGGQICSVSMSNVNGTNQGHTGRLLDTGTYAYIRVMKNTGSTVSDVSATDIASLSGTIHYSCSYLAQ